MCPRCNLAHRSTVETAKCDFDAWVISQGLPAAFRMVESIYGPKVEAEIARYNQARCNQFFT